MAVSRPFLLALIGIVLLGATVFAVRNAPQTRQRRHGTGGPRSRPSPSRSSPEDALASAFSTAPGAPASEPRPRCARRARGTLELSGATTTRPRIPRVALDVKVDAPGTNVQGGFVTTGGEAWFTRGDTGYLVPQEIWDGFASGTRRRGPDARRRSQLPFSIRPIGSRT